MSLIQFNNYGLLKHKDNEKLAKILSEERYLAFNMYQLMNKDSLIGYEAANHYYFNKGMMAEKVLCCEYLKEKMC